MKTLLLLSTLIIPTLSFSQFKIEYYNTDTVLVKRKSYTGELRCFEAFGEVDSKCEGDRLIIFEIKDSTDIYQITFSVEYVRFLYPNTDSKEHNYLARDENNNLLNISFYKESIFLDYIEGSYIRFFGEGIILDSKSYILKCEG